MKIYFGICILMLVLVLIRCIGELIAFKKKYPNAVFKKSNVFQGLTNLIKLLIYFSIPLLNLVGFIGAFFVVKDEEFERIIKDKCEIY
jgi:cytochrome b561